MPKKGDILLFQIKTPSEKVACPLFHADRPDVAMLHRENRDVIDFGYLQDWVKRQELEAEYAEIWREAFPNEPLPT